MYPSGWLWECQCVWGLKECWGQKNPMALATWKKRVFIGFVLDFMGGFKIKFCCLDEMERWHMWQPVEGVQRLPLWNQLSRIDPAKKWWKWSCLEFWAKTPKKSEVEIVNKLRSFLGNHHTFHLGPKEEKWKDGLDTQWDFPFTPFWEMQAYYW